MYYCQTCGYGVVLRLPARKDVSPWEHTSDAEGHAGFLNSDHKIVLKSINEGYNPDEYD